MCFLRKKPKEEVTQERIVSAVWTRDNLTYTQYVTPEGTHIETTIVASGVGVQKATPPTLSIHRDSFGIPFGTFESEPE